MENSLRDIFVASVNCGDKAGHHAGAGDVDEGLTCRMIETLRDLHNLVNQPDFSRGVAAEIIRQCGYVCEMARI